MFVNMRNFFCIAIIILASMSDLQAMKRKHEDPDNLRNVKAKVECSTSDDIIQKLIEEGQKLSVPGQFIHSKDEITKEQVNKIEKLISLGINATDNLGRTALYLAVQYNLPELVEFLLSQIHIDINKTDNDGLTPLSIAVDEGNMAIVKILLARLPKSNMTPEGQAINYRDNKIGFTPLMRAVQLGNEEIVNALLNAGANPFIKSNSGKSAFFLSAKSKDIRKLIVEKKEEYIRNTEEFAEAIIEKNFDKAKKLFLKGFCIEDLPRCKTPLIWAIGTGNKELIQMLIDSKANVDSGDIFRKPALIEAVELGNKDIAKMLIEAKACINAKDQWDSTPLMKASRIGNKDIVQMLIEAKAEVNAVDKFGYTPLIEANINKNKIKVDRKVIIKMLKDAGAKRITCSLLKILFYNLKDDFNWELKRLWNVYWTQIKYKFFLI